MAEETIFVLHAFRMGVFITFLYDCLRVLRRVIAHSGFWVSLEDLLFWCFCASEVFVMMYRVSDGVLRWYAVAGALAGMLLYLHTFSKPFVKYVSRALKKLASLLRRVLGFLFTPVRKAVGGKRINQFLKNRLTLIRKMFKIGMKL